MPLNSSMCVPAPLRSTDHLLTAERLHIPSTGSKVHDTAFENLARQQGTTARMINTTATHLRTSCASLSLVRSRSPSAAVRPWVGPRVLGHVSSIAGRASGSDPQVPSPGRMLLLYRYPPVQDHGMVGSHGVQATPAQIGGGPSGHLRLGGKHCHLMQRLAPVFELSIVRLHGGGGEPRHTDYSLFHAAPL